MVVGNLICSKMTVDWDTELGPDDFPIGMKVTYTLEHGMPRDKAAIQSMFNRGAGRIYKLPDYIKASSDYESKVDDYTGRTDNSWWTPKFMNVSEIQNQAGAHGFQTYKMSQPKDLAMNRNALTTVLTKFMPLDPNLAIREVTDQTKMWLNDGSGGTYATVIRANNFTRKSSGD